MVMSQFELVFDVEAGELVETLYRREPNAAALRCIRGRDAAKLPGFKGSFQWSPAVRALCALVLRYHLYAREAISPEAGFIRGGRGSNAASLDYALGKQPQWLHEIFGTCPKGNARARALIRRINPERKAGGEVILHLNSMALPASSIRIFNNTREELTNETVMRLLRSIEADELQPRADSNPSFIKSWHIDPPRPTLMSGADVHTFLRDLLATWIDEEVSIALFGTDIFTEKSETALIERLIRDPVVAPYIIKQTRQFRLFLDPVGVGKVPCVTDIRHTLEAMPLKIYLTTTIAQVGVILILLAVRKLLGVEVEISFDAPHTTALLRRGPTRSAKRATVLTPLALGAAIEALSANKNLSWHPISVLPGVSYELLGKNLDEHRNLRSELYLFEEGLSTSGLYWRRLLKTGAVSRRAFAVRPGEPHEALQMMQDSDDRRGAVVWFPHAHVSRFLTQARTLVSFRGQQGLAESFLFGDQHAVAQKSLLQSIIRYGWLQLRINPELRRAVIAELVNAPGYFEAFLTYTGLHSYLGHLSTLLSHQKLTDSFVRSPRSGLYGRASR